MDLIAIQLARLSMLIALDFSSTTRYVAAATYDAIHEMLNVTISVIVTLRSPFKIQKEFWLVFIANQTLLNHSADTLSAGAKGGTSSPPAPSPPYGF